MNPKTTIGYGYARSAGGDVIVGSPAFATYAPYRARGGVLGFLKQTFWPPSPFDPSGEEEKFLANYAARFTVHRRAASVIALLAWIVYSGWDFFYGLHDGEFRHTLLTVFVLRSLGTICLTVTTFILARPSIVNARPESSPHDRSSSEPTLSERQLTYFLSSSLCVVFLVHLLMAMVSPFPFDYVVYFPPLTVIMTFAYGLTRLRARAVLFLNVYFMAVSAIILPFAAHSAAGVLSSSYVAYSLSYIFIFAAIGCAVAVELERTARNDFVREQALENSERKAQIDAAALVETTEKLRSLAEQRDLAKSKFLADAAHDLRQPMQALMNLLEAGRYALTRVDVGRCSELLEQAQHAARAARSSFDAVLEISRLESGFVRAEYANFPIQELINDVVAPLLAVAADRGIKVHLRRSCDPNAFVRSDRHLLGRALANLISNAIKYSDPNKGDRATVIIAVICLRDRVRIDIVDNGIGIPKEQWHHVFKPFVQLRNPERDREKGVGLGLSIVDAIVGLLSDHSRDMNSVPGKGTRVSLTVPRVDGAAEADYPDGTSQMPATSPVAGAYVLYVEDDVLVRNSTVSVFEEYRILYEAFGSLHGMEARLRGLERLPDLLITDFRLSDGHSGEDVVRTVAHTFAETLPTIVITGEALSHEQWKCLGNATILRKPVAPEILLAAISALLTGGMRVGDDHAPPGHLD